MCMERMSYFPFKHSIQKNNVKGVLCIWRNIRNLDDKQAITFYITLTECLN